LTSALLINWDNYPNIATGGVYTWSKILVEELSDWNFVVLNQLSNANTNSNYALPENVKQVIELPIYGTFRCEEFCSGSASVIPKIRRTTDSVIKKKFIPLFRSTLANLLSESSDPDLLAHQIYGMHDFFRRYDWKKCFEHPSTLRAFLAHVHSDFLFSNLKLNEALPPYNMLKRGLQLLAIDIPPTDIVHASNAWMPALVAIVAKIQNGSGVIITEHGIAFKELNLYINSSLTTIPSKMFWKIFARNMVRALYAIADSIVTVSEANTLWESSLGASRKKIKIVYNGVDTTKFSPIEDNKALKKEFGVENTSRLVVASIGRVDFFKDIVCLISAIRYIKRYIPNILCLHFGNGVDLKYSQQCLRAVTELGVEDNFKFMGGTKQPEKAYRVGDVVAVSSITEGFPYVVIEAMACGRAVVAADVGGVREALEGCGVLVPSRSPSALGHGILTLLRDEKIRKQFEDLSLQRARDRFTLGRCVEQYRYEYNRLYKKKIGSSYWLDNNHNLREEIPN